jgi:hypothetical protein
LGFDTDNFRFRDKITDPSVRKAAQIADIAFSIYFSDVRALVRSGVEADIQSQIDDRLPNARQLAKSRRKHLILWSRAGDSLLDYGQSNLASLLQAIVTDPTQMSIGLPGMDSNSMSTTKFATLIHSMARDLSPIPLAAPFLLKGAFFPVFKVALTHIVASTPPGLSKEKFSIHVLKAAIECLKIRFIPWAPPHDAPGRPNRNPVWNNWMSLGAEDNNRHFIPQDDLAPEHALNRAAQNAQRSVMSKDYGAEWSTGDITLNNIKSIFKRTVRPSDWITPQPCSSYVLDTYEWVRDRFDPNKPLHGLALLVAIFMSRAIPDIFYPQNTPSFLEKARSRAATRALAREVKWTPKNKVKGMKDGSIFMSMFATFIIAIYEPESPLRIYMKNHGNAMGNDWTDKHSKLLP